MKNVYHSLEELENADVYLTTVIVKRKKEKAIEINNCISSNNMK